MEAAEDRSLTIDADRCRAACAVLTNPRRRIEAELAWFPGTSPNTASRALLAKSLDELDDFPLAGVARINACIAVAAHVSAPSKDQLIRLMDTITTDAEDISSDLLIREINEDREIAGFPAITSVDIVDNALIDRRQEWRRAIADMLAATPSLILVEALNNLVDLVQNQGRFPRLLHEVIDDYALRAQPFIKLELEAAEKVTAKARSLAGSRPDALEPLISALTELLDTWEKVTRPIQLSATSRGRADEESESLALDIRSLSIDLYNEHKLLEISQRISTLLDARFQAIPRIASRVAQDIAALEDLAAQRQQRHEDLAYTANIGLIGQSQLSIDGFGMSWNGEHYPLETITHARWGAVRRSVNGVPTGTDYLIAWGDLRRTAVVTFRNGKIFEAFTNRQWKAIAEQILTRIVDTLAEGRTIQFGNAVIGNDTVVLKRNKFFSQEDVTIPWSEMSVSSHDGSLILHGPSGSRTSCNLSYRNVNNVHFLELIIRTAFKKGRTRLSEAFVD